MSIFFKMILISHLADKSAPSARFRIPVPIPGGNVAAMTNDTHYESITLREELSIKDIYSIHYFEYTKNFIYEGEAHDFWELLFVDFGSIEVTANTQTVSLKKGEMIFHKPNEFHALKADGKVAPNLIVISFKCDAPCMSFFENQIITIDNTEHFYLGQLIAEAKRTFYTPLNNPLVCKLNRYSQTTFGSEQIIKTSLELMLINIFRRLAPQENTQFLPTPAPLMNARNSDMTRMNQIVQYLNKHVQDRLTVSDICLDNIIGKSQLQHLFHRYEGCGVIEYFSRLKIDTAKMMIRENRYSFTEIANILNYSSYQYFSLQFKKYTRMSPSEYSSSTKIFTENNLDAVTPVRASI